MTSRRLVVLLALGLALGCKDPALASEDSPAAARPPAPTTPREVAGWGAGVTTRAPALEAQELARDPGSLPTGDDARTAWTQARIGGPQAVDALAVWLEGGAAATSAHLAALGLLEPPPHEPRGESRWARLEDAVWTRLAVTEDPAEIEALLFAVARIGGERSQARLATLLEGQPSADDAMRAAALHAVGMLCAREFPSTVPGLEAIARHLEATLAEPAAYAVSRCAGPSAELLAGEVRGSLVERLTPSLGAEDPEQVRVVWKALAALGEVPASIPAEILGATPPPWRVEVEAVRAMGGHADGRAELSKRLSTLSPAAFEGPRVHVLLVALQGLRDAVVGTPEILRQLSTLRSGLKTARDQAQGRRRKALALASCEAELLAAIGSGDFTALRGCADGVDALPSGYAETLEIEALLRVGASLTREDKAKQLLARAADARATVAATAMAALVDVDDPGVSEALRAGLRRADPGVQAAAAAALATRARDRARRDEAALPLLEHGVAQWPNATTIEARIAAIEALGNLARSGGKDENGDLLAPWLRTSVLPLASDPAVAVRRAAQASLQGVPALVEAFEQALSQPRVAAFDPSLEARRSGFADVTGLRVVTSAGEMVIAYEGPAVWNQATVASLADEGFYDGLSFHRVVPGFVIQGGDPRGDGYGGPGFLVPCEWSNQKYERGVVGMALAGKDTGGSQFFVAQAREPRLDGRYTILGRVTEGLDVLDAILPHDIIERIEVIRG